MNHHEHVQCDVCVKDDFSGCRYKCLICRDYDLCRDCYECGVSSGNHIISHPMQCIWTRADLTLFYGGEDVDNPSTHCYTCPYCGELGWAENTLMEHVVSTHRHDGEISSQVLCPICACRPAGNNNVVITDLAAHLVVEHQIPSPPNIPPRVSEMTAAVVRSPQSAPPPTRRNSASNSNRNTLDSFLLELMAHLPDVRFGAGVNAGAAAAPSGASSAQALQQIQLQLRQHQLQGRQQLEMHRMARRAISGQLTPNEPPALPDGPPPVATAAHTSRNVGGGFNLLNEGRSTARASGGTGRSAATRAINAELAEVAAGGDVLFGRSVIGGARTTKSGDRGKFLLNKFLNQELSSTKHAQRDRDRADRSLFVQALLLSALSTDFNAVEAEAGGLTIEEQLARMRSSNSGEDDDRPRRKIKKNKKKKKKPQADVSFGESSMEIASAEEQVVPFNIEEGEEATQSTEV